LPDPFRESSEKHKIADDQLLVGDHTCNAELSFRELFGEIWVMEVKIANRAKIGGSVSPDFLSEGFSGVGGKERWCTGGTLVEQRFDSNNPFRIFLFGALLEQTNKEVNPNANDIWRSTDCTPQRLSEFSSGRSRTPS